MFPGLIKLLKLLVPLDAVLSQASYKILRCLSVLLGDHPLSFNMGLSVLLGFFVVALTGYRREDGWSGKNFVEVLELLSGSLFVTVSHWTVIDLIYIGEAVDDKGTQEYSI